MIQEARVRLYARKFLALKVEYLDCVDASSAIKQMSVREVDTVDGKHLHSKNREVLMCARRAKRMIRGLDNP